MRTVILPPTSRLKFGVSRAENVDMAPVTDKFYDAIAAGHRRADDRTRQGNQRLTSQIARQGRQPHSIKKRSPEDSECSDLSFDTRSFCASRPPFLCVRKYGEKFWLSARSGILCVMCVWC